MINQTGSCGVFEFDGLTSPRDFFVQVNEKYSRNGFHFAPFAFLVFSDNKTQPKIGERVAKIIKGEGLGDIVETKYRKNPNSGRMIRVWVWAPKFKAVRKYVNNLAK
jgi:hypothetical protein